MSFSNYPEYKDSGVEWLGEIPVHWDMVPLKYLCSFSSGGTPEKDKIEYWNGDIPWISPKDMKGPVISSSIDKVNELAIKESSTSLTEPGAVLIVVRSGILQRTIPIGINSVAITINQDIKALRFSMSGFERYFPYLVKGLEPSWLLEWRKQGATVESIEHEYLAASLIPVPPMAELIKVVAFLDHETAKIDALICEQERLIELLDEKRHAVISHAVTKGLDPDVPMKDSGVEWLGEVPAHWEVRKLSTITEKITNGYVGPTRGLFVDDGIKYLQSLHIKGNAIRFTPPYFVPIEWSNAHSKSILKEGDVLVVQTGDIGQSAVVPKEFAGSNCHALIVVSPVEDVLYGEFLSWVLNSGYGKNTLLSIKTGALHPHLNCGYVKDIWVPLPPKSEQRKIVSFLRAELQSFQGLTEQAKRMADFLRERRSALISAAVTGKIDVRNWQPPEESAFKGGAETNEEATA